MSVEEDPYSEIRAIERSRTEAKKHYDRISSFYNHIEGAFEKKYRDMALDLFEIRSGERVLEIGFGTGHALKEIANRVGLEGRIIGIDISTEMCEITRERLVGKNSLENADLICADAISIPLEENVFDKIFMSFTLELFSELEIKTVLNEIKRLLDEKGKLCVVSLSKEEDTFVELYERLHDFFPQILDCRPIYPAKMLEDRNFEVEEVKREKMVGLPIQIVIAMSR